MVASAGVVWWSLASFIQRRGHEHTFQQCHSGVHLATDRHDVFLCSTMNVIAQSCPDVPRTHGVSKSIPPNSRCHTGRHLPPKRSQARSRCHKNQPFEQKNDACLAAATPMNVHHEQSLLLDGSWQYAAAWHWSHPVGQRTDHCCCGADL